MQKLKIDSDESKNTYTFITHTLLASSIALITGAIVDNIIKKYQKKRELLKDENKKSVFMFFLIQLIVNILLMVFAMALNDNFVSWIQLTLSGMISSVLFFVVQNNWTNNVIMLTNII